MWNLGFMAFAQPWILAALIGLPVIWWLLRLTPPAPRRFKFPAIRLLTGLSAPEETPATTPWWLLLMRLAIVALIILGLSQPLWNPNERLAGSGPLVLVMDNGWGAARYWPNQMAEAEQLINQAEREGRNVLVLPTAPAAEESEAPSLTPLPANEARRVLSALTPQPWPADRAGLAERLAELTLDGRAGVVWLSDGLAAAQGQAADTALAETLGGLGDVTVYTYPSAALPHLLLPPVTLGGAMTLQVERPVGAGSSEVVVQAYDEDGSLIAQVPLSFDDGETTGDVPLDLPAELRNRIAVLAIAGENTAGARFLIDERWRRRPVGLVTTEGAEAAQPLLSEDYYLTRALEPFTELRKGSIAQLLERDLAILVVPDAANPLTPEDRLLIEDWVRDGGLLLRFAGPDLAAQLEEDSLLPAKLRRGDRVMGGVLTWDSPARLAPFETTSPFANLAQPDDLVVKRQVLAEPSLELANNTWATLSDGTPLVTAAQDGAGWLVLFHVNANSEWSDLPLSGLFVEMLQRVLGVSQGVAGRGGEVLQPIEVMDGLGRLGAPAPFVQPLPTVTGAQAAPAEESDPPAGTRGISPQHPPGYYGTKEERIAHNMGDSQAGLAPLADLPNQVQMTSYNETSELDLKPWLLLAAFVLLLLDLVISLFMRGLFVAGSWRQQGTTAVLVLATAITVHLALPPSTWAQSANSDYNDRRALEATLVPRLAYVVTDDPHVDDISRAGLSGLTLILQRRTSVEPGPPLPVDLEVDELAFFPLLYWPITGEQPPLSSKAKEKLNDYMNSGGTILFDMRDPAAGSQILGQSSLGSQNLQRLVDGLEIPDLTPIPPEHVINKSFYLLQDYPGRYTGGTLWVESGENSRNDAVTSVVIGANDWASAWAVNALGQPVNVLVPGGHLQREMAYRFGVNLVMHALTGNYKADQVHIPFILERLGQ